MEDQALDQQNNDSITAALLQQGKSVRVTPSGNSMLPLLNGVTDSVVLEKAPEKLQVGDLAFYKNARGILVVHRVWSVDGDSYTMLGDGNTQLEHGIPAENVYGLAKEITRGSKTLPASCWQLKTYGAVWKAVYPLRLLRQKIWNLSRRVRGA